MAPASEKGAMSWLLSTAYNHRVSSRVRAISKSAVGKGVPPFDALDSSQLLRQPREPSTHNDWRMPSKGTILPEAMPTTSTRLRVCILFLKSSIQAATYVPAL